MKTNKSTQARQDGDDDDINAASSGEFIFFEFFNLLPPPVKASARMTRFSIFSPFELFPGPRARILRWIGQRRGERSHRTGRS